MLALATRVSPKSCLPYLSASLSSSSLAISSLAEHNLSSENGFHNSKSNPQHLPPRDISQPLLASRSLLEQLKNPPSDSKALLEDIRLSAKKFSLENESRSNKNADISGSFIEGIHSPVFLPKPEILLASNLHNSTLNTSGGKDSGQDSGGPDLKKVSSLLTIDLLNVFIRPMDWNLYHPSMVFEDNIRGKRYENALAYRMFVNQMKIYCHMRFVYVRFNILKVTEHPEDGTIRVRWRISGMGALKMAIKYIPHQMWKRGNMDKAADSWYDGYSTFYVDSDNKIVKHVADKMMPDEETKIIGKSLVDKLKRLKPAPAAPAL